MKGATQCAKRLKDVIKRLKKSTAEAPPSSGDPIAELVLGVLTRDQPESRAQDALKRMLRDVVDFNELRVIPTYELEELVGGNVPDVRTKCDDISRALNFVFARRHAVSLDFAAAMSKRESAEYLLSVEGLEPYTAARIRLFGFEQHAFPLDEAMWAFARANEIVDPKCDLLEAQSFLERQISEKDARVLYAALREAAWAEFRDAVRKQQVERIQSVPPDRTSQHMLRDVSEGVPSTPAVVANSQPAQPVREEVAEAPEEEEEPKRKAAPARSARKSKAKAGAAAKKPARAASAKSATGKKTTAKRTTSRKTRKSSRSAGSKSA